MQSSRCGRDDMKKVAYGALLVLQDNLPSNCKLRIEDEEEIVISALKRHGDHISTHRVDQEHLDAFKLLCWLGGALIERLETGESYTQHETILEALIVTLEEVLVLETNRQVKLTPKDHRLIKQFVMEEIKGNPDHGIGFNGLFIAFHCLRSTYKQLFVHANGSAKA